MTLRINEDGEWVMPRGLSVHDMANEIKDAVGHQDHWLLPPVAPPPTTKELTIARQYVKVTQHGNARKKTMSLLR